MYSDRRWPPFALHEDLLLPGYLHLYIILVIDQLNLYDSLISFLYKPTTNSGLNNILYIVCISIKATKYVSRLYYKNNRYYNLDFNLSLV